MGIAVVLFYGFSSELWLRARKVCGKGEAGKSISVSFPWIISFLYEGLLQLQRGPETQSPGCQRIGRSCKSPCKSIFLAIWDGQPVSTLLDTD